MGTKSSKTESDQKEEILQKGNTPKKVQLQPKIYESNAFKNTDNYDEESFSTSQATQIEHSSQEKKEDLKEPKKYPYKFEWKGNGKSVLLTGDFLDNWNGIKVMIKNNENDVFEKVVYLTKTKHQFKFIVDDNWICSGQYPTMHDERGIMNNFIDLKNYNPPESLIKNEESKRIKAYNEQKEKEKKYINKYYKTNEYEMKSLIFELNSKPPKIIEHYRPGFDIDYQSNQSKIKSKKKKKYLKFKEKNTLTENNAYKKILTCPHEKLMHFCPHIKELVDEKNHYIKISTTIRNRHKFLTTVYYKPKQLL